MGLGFTYEETIYFHFASFGLTAEPTRLS